MQPINTNNDIYIMHLLHNHPIRPWPVRWEFWWKRPRCRRISPVEMSTIYKLLLACHSCPYLSPNLRYLSCTTSCAALLNALSLISHLLPLTSFTFHLSFPIGNFSIKIHGDWWVLPFVWQDLIVINQTRRGSGGSLGMARRKKMVRWESAGVPRAE